MRGGNTQDKEHPNSKKN